MTDFEERPEYGLGMFDRSGGYDWTSAAIGHLGRGTLALCLPRDGIIVVVLANVERDVETVAGNLVHTANS
jgi:hypothetical protein